MMGCSAAAVSAEAQIGLPEAKVGLLPGGGGTALVRLRSQFGGPKRMSELAHQIGQGYVAANAPEALKRGYLRETDRIVFHPDRLFYEAKQMALAIEPAPMPTWLRPEGPLAGMIDRLLAESKAKGESTEHDFSIGQAVKTVFAKSVTLEDALAKERSEFIELCKKALTVTRIRHMLESGKPLKN
jgi:3-hydroxyacyl-CoA dehydrogenase